MKTNNNNKIWSFIKSFIFNTITAMIIWPLINMFFDIVIKKKEFVYTADDYILQPIMYGAFLTVFTMILNNRDRKKAKSSEK